MKKLLLIASIIATLMGSVFASNYKLNDNAVNQLISLSKDITISVSSIHLYNYSISSPLPGEEKTVGGFLVRAFFCGEFALHRSYMGTGGKNLFCQYFCIGAFIPVTCIDFWWVVIDGQEALDKYKDNPKFFVW